MTIAAKRGRRGSPRTGAGGADAGPAFLSPAADRGTGAGPQRAEALPCETEFRTGKTEGGFRAPCFSKGLAKSRIGNRVKRSSKNRGSGRESALTFAEKSEPTDVGCYGKWRFVSASKVTNHAAPIWPGLTGKMGPGAPVRHSVPNGERGQADPPSELSSEGCQNAVFGPYFKEKQGARPPVANSVRNGEKGQGQPPSKFSFEGCRHAVVFLGPDQPGSAGFQTCRGADFQVGWRLLISRASNLPDPCRFGNRRYGRFGNLRYVNRLRFPGRAFFDCSLPSSPAPLSGNSHVTCTGQSSLGDCKACPLDASGLYTTCYKNRKTKFGCDLIPTSSE